MQLAGIVKEFGATRVLHGVDLDIAPGEFVAVLGESGVGKSTFLNCLAGLDTVDTGTVTIAGRDVTVTRPVTPGPSENDTSDTATTSPNQRVQPSTATIGGVGPGPVTGSPAGAGTGCG